MALCIGIQFPWLAGWCKICLMWQEALLEILLPIWMRDNLPLCSGFVKQTITICKWAGLSHYSVWDRLHLHFTYSIPGSCQTYSKLFVCNELVVRIEPVWSVFWDECDLIWGWSCDRIWDPFYENRRLMIHQFLLVSVSCIRVDGCDLKSTIALISDHAWRTVMMWCDLHCEHSDLWVIWTVRVLMIWTGIVLNMHDLDRELQLIWTQCWSMYYVGQWPHF
jgi:hypothetical protein